MSEQQELNKHCIDRGTLLALRDAELSGEEISQVEQHLASCESCIEVKREIDEDGQDIYSLLATLRLVEAEIPKTATSLAIFSARLNAGGQKTQVAEKYTRKAVRKPLPRWRVAAALLAAAALILVAFSGAGLSRFLDLFQVQKFQPVTVDPQSLRYELSNTLYNFGTLQMQSDQVKNTNNLTRDQLQKLISFPLKDPQTLPPGTGAVKKYALIQGGAATFTFSAETTRAYLDQHGLSKLTIPASLDGKVFQLQIAPGAIISYFKQCTQSSSQAQASEANAGKETTKQKMECSGGDSFSIMELPSPVLQGVGQVSLQDLRSFLLSIPSLSQSSHDLLQAMDPEKGIIPVPIPQNQASAQNVTVNGAQGLFLTASEVNAGGLLWQKDGLVYLIIAATNDQGQLLKSAGSLG